MNNKNFKDFQDMNVQQIRTYIRQLTKDANKVRLETEGEKYMTRLANEIASRNDMQNKKTGAFVGRLNFKTKDQLISQALDLQQFINADTLSKRARKEREKLTKQRYETFKENIDEDISYEEYKDLVHNFSAIKDLVDYFGSEQTQEIMKEVKAAGHTQDEIIRAMRDVMREEKGEGSNPFQSAKSVYAKFGLDIFER